MLPSKLWIAAAFAAIGLYGQLPSAAERALKLEQARKDAAARRAAVQEKQRENEEARRKASEERQAAAGERRSRDAEARAQSNAANEQRRASSASARSKPGAGQDMGITGPLHEKYRKKFVFVTKDQPFDKINEADFTSEFTLRSSIYFRVYLETSTPKALAKLAPDTEPMEIARQMFYGMRVTLDGKGPIDLKFRQFSTVRNNLEWTTWRGFLVAEPGQDISSDQGGEVFREFLSRASQKGWLTPGKHKLKLELYPWMELKDKPVMTGDVIATGEVAMVVPAGAINSSNRALCVTYKQALKDPAIEAQVMRYANTAWKPTEYKPYSAMLTSHAWTIYRHPVSGIITHRSIDTAVLSKGAEYCKFQGYQFSQVFEGNSYAAGTFTSSEPISHFMPCACLTK